MTLAETIYQHSLRLPEPAAREALDFIEFLEQRYAIADPSDSLPTRETTRKLALVQLARLRIKWNGKPIPDRDALYDDVRAGD
jgi:hypothetical protein